MLPCWGMTVLFPCSAAATTSCVNDQDIVVVLKFKLHHLSPDRFYEAISWPPQLLESSSSACPRAWPPPCSTKFLESYDVALPVLERRSGSHPDMESSATSRRDSPFVQSHGGCRSVVRIFAELQETFVYAFTMMIGELAYLIVLLLLLEELILFWTDNVLEAQTTCRTPSQDCLSEFRTVLIIQTRLFSCCAWRRGSRKRY